MEGKTILEEMTKEDLARVLIGLEPGTMLTIDMPEKTTKYADSIQGKKGAGEDAGIL